MKSIMKKVNTLLLVPILVFSTGTWKVSAAENTEKVQLTVEYGQAEARTVTDMVNEFRTGDQAWYWNADDTTKTELQGKLGELTYDETLEKAAMKRAAELALSYSHTRLNGKSCFTAFDEFGYSGTAKGENIAYGYPTFSAEEVFIAWREDNKNYSGQGHRRNMLSESFTAIGMGHVYYNGQHYWAMELGNVASGTDTGIDGVQTVELEVISSDKPGNDNNDGTGSDTPGNTPGGAGSTGSNTPGDTDDIGSDVPGNTPDSGNNTASGNKPSDDNNSNNNNDSNDSSNSDKNASNDEQKSSNIIASTTPSIVIPVTSVVGGIKTSTEGIYLATSCNGTIVSTPTADISKGYALASNEKPYNKFYNFDAKKSSLAKNTIDSAAASLKATVGPMLNIELGKMSGGKYSLLSSDGEAIRLVLGIPKTFAQSDKTFAVICVREGGVYTVLKDLDTNPDTITFDTTGGAGVYAIVKY